MGVNAINQTAHHTTSHRQAREAAGAVQDVGCRAVPLHEDNEVHLPDVHDACERAEDSDCRYGHCIGTHQIWVILFNTF